MQATERARSLVADPVRMGLKPRAGLEPLDVAAKFNRAAAHTRSAFQMHVTMRLSLDGSGNPPFTTATALVAEGKTKAELLEMFYNWMADDEAVMRFVAEVKAHEAKQLDALAQAELDKKRAQEAKVARGAKAMNQAWLDRKLDDVGRKLGLVKARIQK